MLIEKTEQMILERAALISKVLFIFTGCLVELYASYNKISRLPDPDHWECSQLYLMELAHNCLGPKPTNR